MEILIIIFAFLILIIAFLLGRIKGLNDRNKQSELVIETLEARLELANGEGITVDELFKDMNKDEKY